MNTFALLVLVTGVVMGPPLRIPKAHLVSSSRGRIARNASIAIETQFVAPDAVAVRVDGRPLKVRVETGQDFAPGTKFTTYFLVRPEAGSWPAAKTLHVRISDGDESVLEAAIRTSGNTLSQLPARPHFKSPTLETGPVYMGEVYERKLLRIPYDALDATAGPVMRLHLQLLDRVNGDVLDESGFVATGKSGSVLVQSDSLRCIAGGELIDLAGNQTIISAADGCTVPGSGKPHSP